MIHSIFPQFSVEFLLKRVIRRKGIAKTENIY
jgi:hypothetical protein